MPLETPPSSVISLDEASPTSPEASLSARPDLPPLSEPGNRPQVEAGLQRIFRELGMAQEQQEQGTKVDRANVFQLLADLERIIGQPENDFLLSLRFKGGPFVDAVRANADRMIAELLGIKPAEPVITSVDQVPAEIRREIEKEAGQQREVEELEKKLQEEQEYSHRLQEKLLGNETTEDKLPSPIVIRDKIFTPKKRLGGGKYGEVYLADITWEKAYQADQRYEVALKVENLGLDDKEKQLFDRELETLNALGIYQKNMFGLQEADIFTPISLGGGFTNEGRNFLAMTLAEGRPLDELLREGKKLDLSAIRSIGRQLCMVFEALHNGVKRGYLDFQPKNVFWDEKRNKITVVDWNLLTTNFYYMTEVQRAEAVDNDIKSIGKVLFRLAAGKAYQKDLPAEEQIGLVPENLGLRFVILKALTEKPDEQYVSAEQMKQFLI